jgi:tetratricopeptide (TPR) repeat protein
MKILSERFVALVLIVLFLMTPVWATCGGGGGGGGGGMSGGGGGGSDPAVYHVPWKILKEGETVSDGLVLYWFPASKEELQKSTLRESRNLSLYASQCTSMQLADNRTPKAEDLIGASKLPVVVLAKPDGTVIKKVENTDGKFKVADVEKVVGDEIKGREEVVDTNLRDGKAKEATDKAEAAKLLQAVVAEKCMFPKKAKDAEKELKKIGVTSQMNVPDIAPNFDPKVTAAIVRTMKQGLVAENKAQYVLADKLYTQAHNMDPADPTPLRYLGELYRHHIGDWAKARVIFDQILAMPADPLSRGVALHGLGKMTIHEGEFLKGLHLMEDAADVYPLALTYRNLAVYWNSEGDLAKGNYYTDKAIAIDPTDPYNVVFAAVFMAANGRSDEALKIANQHIDLLPASYNLAAIYAQTGQKEKALDMLKRHFYKFERYESVRAKEMMEARVDMMFDSLRNDKGFMALTAGADGRLPIPASKTMGGGGMNSSN